MDGIVTASAFCKFYSYPFEIYVIITVKFIENVKKWKEAFKREQTSVCYLYSDWNPQSRSVCIGFFVAVCMSHLPSGNCRRGWS